ncbi:hypothetical protein SUGI_0035020 [Cryptomeria japonica]|nr:hypothetical protein SUGI_0035020 [Cryptomeria japonica]
MSATANMTRFRKIPRTAPCRKPSHVEPKAPSRADNQQSKELSRHQKTNPQIQPRHSCKGDARSKRSHTGGD